MRDPTPLLVAMRKATASLALVLAACVNRQSVTVPLDNPEALPCIEGCRRDHQQDGYFDCLAQCPSARRTKTMCRTEDRSPTLFCDDGAPPTEGARLLVVAVIGTFLFFAAIGGLPIDDWVGGGDARRRR